MDALVGCDGLPDLDSAPFINAAVKELSGNLIQIGKPSTIIQPVN